MTEDKDFIAHAEDCYLFTLRIADMCSIYYPQGIKSSIVIDSFLRLGVRMLLDAGIPKEEILKQLEIWVNYP